MKKSSIIYVVLFVALILGSSIDSFAYYGGNCVLEGGSEIYSNGECQPMVPEGFFNVCRAEDGRCYGS